MTNISTANAQYFGSSFAQDSASLSPLNQNLSFSTPTIAPVDLSVSLSGDEENLLMNQARSLHVQRSGMSGSSSRSSVHDYASTTTNTTSPRARNLFRDPSN